MANAPIQVILNADDYRHDRQTSTPKSAGTDFFLGKDKEFREHKEILSEQIADISRQLVKNEYSQHYGEVGYVRVSMRSSALAKSHRPLKLFQPEKTPSVGGDHLGEMICAVTPDALAKVEHAIEKAEVIAKERVDRKTGEVVPAPSRYRCEVGAIKNVELWSKSRRRRFDLDSAIKWLTDPRTGHVYVVELFELPPPETLWDTLSDAKRMLFKSFSEGLRELGPGLIARIPDGLPSDLIFAEIRLIQGTAPSAVFVSGKRAIRHDHPEIFDADQDRHRALIGFLESHPLVREIHLPTALVKSHAPPLAVSSNPPVKITSRVVGRVYPKVGVIDGGISSVLNEWITTQWGLLAPEHQELEHGSFIGGLLLESASRNPQLLLDPDGCELADINIFPDENQKTAFGEYYPNGTGDFFDEIENAVETCRTQFGVRVFNLSISVERLVHIDRYSLEARRLDQIAEKHNVVFVLAAGNLSSGNLRPEWPDDDAKASAILASHRDDGLFSPAESVRNISVAAINPPGLSNCIPEAPARYSRRGPGLRTGVKPDLCHFGGSGTPCPTNGFGLSSIAPDGSHSSACGTSYAAPLVAKTLGCLDMQIEGDVSRETLMALAIHSASPPALLNAKAFEGVAQQLVGFGRPSDAAQMLAGETHQITLLFSSRIYNGKTLEFRFTWPPSLVTAKGKCRGDVRLTLVSSPTLDHRFGAEFVRANIEAALQQETKTGSFKRELEPTYVFFSKDEKTREADLIEHQFKWAPVKVFGKQMKIGRGVSSNWRLAVNYLTRAGEVLPEEGVPFSILLTIADPQKEKPIFQEMRQTLQASGISTADIRTAARVTSRV